MKPTTIYLIRHGESLGNAMYAAGTPIKSKDEFESSLTQLGKDQIELTVQKLSQVPFTHIYSSHLRRAKESAEIAAKHFRVPHAINLGIYERRVISAHNTTPAEMQKKYGKLLEKEKTLTPEERLHFKLSPTDESIAETRSRFMHAMQEIVRAHEGGTILVVSHGAVMKNFLAQINFASWEKLEKTTIANAGYVKLVFDGSFQVQDTYLITEIEDLIIEI